MQVVSTVKNDTILYRKYVTIDMYWQQHPVWLNTPKDTYTHKIKYQERTKGIARSDGCAKTKEEEGEGGNAR